MVQINFAAREINCKIVYYGPGRSGKTTNLEQVHINSPKKCVGEMVSIATETDRTLFFDFLPLDIGKVAGMQVKFQLYTVPGQVYYNATRKLVLQGVDGVIFVADSQRSMLEENLESLQNLYDNLRENGFDPETVPIIMQWNKRDLPDVMSVEELEEKLNPKKYPSASAVASEGKGVFETLKKIAIQVLDKLNKEYGGAKDKPTAPPAAPSAPKPTEPPAAVPASPPVSARPPAVKPAPAPPSPPRPAASVAVPARPQPQPARPEPVAQPPKPATPPPPPRQEPKKGGSKWIWLIIAFFAIIMIGLLFAVLKYMS
ncbi:MAG: hypothetical protein Kow00107_04810 [Planctomycetota bacterium]